MAIRASIRADLHALDGLEAYLANTERATNQIMKGVVDKNGNKYLKKIRRKGGPGRSKHGASSGAWSTNSAADDRARRWWFWAVGSGKIRTAGGRYIRTGGLQKRWVLVVRKNRASLENSDPRAKYVFTFAQRPRARGGRPNPGHIRTGWPQDQRRKALAALDALKSDVSFAFGRSVAASVANGQFTIVIP